MASFKQLLLASTAGLLMVGGAQAADLPTQKTPPAPPAAASPCSPLLNNIGQMHSPVDFFNTPGTLTCYGITLYGTLDEGMGYESHGVPWNSQMYTADEELIQKNSYKPMFNYTPNGLSQSVIGIKGQEPIPGIAGTSVVFDAETGFDPGSFRLGNALGAQIDNNGVPLNEQNANADGARAGQIFNSQVYVGLSNTTFGTLTWGRQNTLDLDGINAYDPMGGSYAFSVIGYSGATAGAGNTEDTRSNSALKYRVNYGQFRFGAMVQTGGFEQGNGAQGLYEVQVGGDFGNLSVDAIYSHLTDAVSSATYTPALGGALTPTQLAAVNAQQLTATLSDNDAVTLAREIHLGRLEVLRRLRAHRVRQPDDRLLDVPRRRRLHVQQRDQQRLRFDGGELEGVADHVDRREIRHHAEPRHHWRLLPPRTELVHHPNRDDELQQRERARQLRGDRRRGFGDGRLALLEARRHLRRRDVLGSQRRPGQRLPRAHRVGPVGRPARPVLISLRKPGERIAGLFENLVPGLAPGDFAFSLRLRDLRSRRRIAFCRTRILKEARRPCERAASC